MESGIFYEIVREDETLIFNQSKVRSSELDMMNRFGIAVISAISVLMSGCQNASAPEPVAVETPTPVVTAMESIATPDYLAAEPLSAEEAMPPVLIEIPSVGLLHSITPMEWEVADVDGQRTTIWKVPDDAAGWHIDSSGVGASGNVILSGHQEQDGAVFKPIALGSVQIGHDVYLTDESGRTYAYKVTEVSEPIPLDGATTEQFGLIEAYYSQSAVPRLTLITGWPDFSTTHRIFVIAELAGIRG